MRIFIAGCGYVGIRLAARLHAAGHGVFGMRRNPPEVDPNVTWIRGDLTKPDSVLFPERLEVVVLASGLRRDTDERYQQLFVKGYFDFLDHLRSIHQPIKRVIMISTTGVFAEDKGGWVDESSPVDTNHAPGRFYLEAEDVVRQFKWPAVVVRLAGIYGPERLRLITEVREGRARLLPPPPDFLNHIHADDAAGIIDHIINLPEADPLYVASDREPVDRNDVLRWIAGELKSGPIPPAKPDSPRPTRRSGNKRCRSDRLVASGYKFIHPSFKSGYKAILKAK